MSAEVERWRKVTAMAPDYLPEVRAGDALAAALEDTVAERDLAVRQLRAVRELLAELVADLADAVGANP